MKKLLPYLYLFIPTAIVLAEGTHGGGHPEEVADPSKRIYVMIGVAIVFIAMISWFIWSKRKIN